MGSLKRHAMSVFVLAVILGLVILVLIAAGDTGASSTFKFCDYAAEGPPVSNC